MIMDEESDVQIVYVSEPERESDEFEDGVKESFNRCLCRNLLGLYKSIAIDAHAFDYIS